jgi:hypothetical protein
VRTLIITAEIIVGLVKLRPSLTVAPTTIPIAPFFELVPVRVRFKNVEPNRAFRFVVLNIFESVTDFTPAFQDNLGFTYTSTYSTIGTGVRSTVTVGFARLFRF